MWPTVSSVSTSDHDPDIAPIVQEFAAWPGGLLPALHAVQHHVGYIDAAHIPFLADTFNLSVAEVHGVITFYKDFRTTPPAGPVVHVCRAEACLSRGGGALHQAAIDAAAGQPVEIDEVFCLGLCTQGPAVAAGDQLFVGVTPDSLGTIIEHVARRVDSGPRPETGGDGITVYVPADAAARAAGADDVAAAFAAQHGVRIVRNGSHGMLWLEPLVEFAT